MLTTEYPPKLDGILTAPAVVVGTAGDEDDPPPTLA